MIPALKIPYGRPAALSNPGRDFSPAELREILATPECELGWREFCRLFQAGLPAGDYRECAYFLPHALRAAADPECGADILSLLINWTAWNWQELTRDGLYEPLLAHLRDLFAQTVAHFELRENSEHVLFPAGCSLAQTLIDEGNAQLDGLGDKLMRDFLDDVSSYERAAWFCFLLASFYQGVLSESKLLEDWSRDRNRLTRAVETISRRTGGNETLNAYRNAVFVRCGVR